MKDIKLCGLGNGLVDIQYEVTNQELEQLGIGKGLMLLVSPEEQVELLKKLKNKNRHVCSGGSAANTIIAFRKFGGTAAYKTVLGRDDFGKFYSNEFTEMDIILRATYLDRIQTGTCIVLITPDSERTMHTSLGATSKFSVNEIDEFLIKRSEWLYIEGYKFSEPSSTDAIFLAMEYALKHKTKVAVSFSDKFITDSYRDNLMKVAEKSELIFCNESEALSFTKSKNVDDAFQKLCGISEKVALTRGANGSMILWDSVVYEIPAYQTKAIDTTGAGDMFAAGFLYGIVQTGEADLAGHLGSLAASKIVAQLGARYKGDHVELRNKILANSM